MPKFVIVFDMDGVLVDVAESYRATIVETVAHFTGRRIERNSIQDYKNQGGWNNDWALSQKIASDLGVEVDYDTVVREFQKIFFGPNGNDGLMQRERWLPENGLLERLAARAHLALFTGRTCEEAAMTLSRFVPDVDFDAIIGSDSVSRPKPEPEGLVTIRGQFPGSALIYLGDTVDDARSARAAGVPFLGIVDGTNPRAAEVRRLHLSLGAVAVVENVNRIEEYLPE